MKATMCDRCGALSPDEVLREGEDMLIVMRRKRNARKPLDKMSLYDEWKPYDERPLDLCPECRAELQKWIEGGGNHAR